MSKSTVALAAGGTGGHLFAAIAVAQEMKEQGLLQPLLITDLNTFPKEDGIERIMIPEMSLKRTFIKKITSGFRAVIQLVRLIYLYKRRKIKLVIGFGGYTSFIPCMAAKLCRIPIISHEQNAILGRANRIMAKYAKFISLGFPVGIKLPKHLAKKCVLTRNPVRGDLLKVTEKCTLEQGCFSILVIGGSQGARVFSSIVPRAIEIVRKDYSDKKIKICHQYKGQTEQLELEYKRLNVDFEISPFFPDIAKRYLEAQLVICRAGASTLEELVQTCKPAILIPLPSSANDHQKMNAEYLSSKGAAWLVEENESCHLRVASIMLAIIKMPQMLDNITSKLLELKSAQTLTLTSLITNFLSTADIPKEVQS